MKILITGIAGLLGSRLADWIIENTDNEVIGIDGSPMKLHYNVHSHAHDRAMEYLNTKSISQSFLAEALLSGNIDDNAVLIIKYNKKKDCLVIS